MMLKALAFVFFIACVSGAGHNIPNIPNFIPTRPSEPKWKASPEYLELRKHDITTRDHGCVELEDVEHEQPFTCVNIWLKNRFSETQTKPTAIFLDYQHSVYEKHDAYKPTVTWVENVNPWRVRGCVAHPGGKKNTLKGGKLRWLAVYNTPKTQSEQYGKITNFGSLTSASKCVQLNFPVQFTSTPALKFTVKLRHGLMTAQDALVVWARGVTQTGATVCAEEFYGWSRYHHEFDIEWYGIAASHNQDFYSTHGRETFPANVNFPVDHKDLNHFYCKNVTLPRWHFPCPAVLVQAVEQNTAVCESTLVAWVSYLKNDMMTVCYADKRGIMGIRKVEVQIHYIIYGAEDKCEKLQCPDNQECMHTSWNTVKCGCYKKCDNDYTPACGTNMMTYKNRCHLEKAACESGDKFSYAHHGKCEEHTFAHGRHQLTAVAGCDGLYCADISTGNKIWYEHAKINVQISVNWMSSIHGDRLTTHDATASWVENVTPNGFKACIMEVGRRALANGPHINWFAYQGHYEHIMSHKIEVGDWKSGTHCAPIHERKVLERPRADIPRSCPTTDLNEMPKKEDEDEERFHYDSGMMSKLHGKSQYEWFKRMMTGYGVKKLKLTSGMHLKGANLMLTVEQGGNKVNKDKVKDAVNAWIEYDGATQEAYVCLREMQNWDGYHKDIHVHWTLFMDKRVKREDIVDKVKDMMEDRKEDEEKPTGAPSTYAPSTHAPSTHAPSTHAPSTYGPSTYGPSHAPSTARPDMDMMYNDFGLIQHMMFKPAFKAPEENDYAFCQMKRFLPESFSANHPSTVLVSLGHLIPAHAAFESMKKFKLYKEEILRGMPMGDLSFNDEKPQPSWMLPAMWRANLTGWRPHMRIAKNTDYSAWVEGMNNTHIRVCQKSINNGYYQGVKVALTILPDPCPAGYTPYKGKCARLSAKCGSDQEAEVDCGVSNDRVGAPMDGPRNVFYSYLAGQQSLRVSISDKVSEGTWARGDGEQLSYSRWAEGEPKSSPSDLDCAVQSGRSKDFTMAAARCNDCYKYVCEKDMPELMK